MRIHSLVFALLLAFIVSSASTLSTTAPVSGLELVAQAQEPASARATLIARAKSFELNTPYVPPPGDPLEHDAAGFAKVMCSAVFITGLDPDFAAKNVGGFTAPFEKRSKSSKPAIDRANKTVTVTLPNG